MLNTKTHYIRAYNQLTKELNHNKLIIFSNQTLA